MSVDESTQERKNRRMAMVISFTLHGAIIAVLFFLAAWRAPDPPTPDYGIELNFGLDAAGSGTEQTQAETVESESVEQVQPQEAAQTEVVESEPEEVTAVETPTESPVVVKPSKPEVKKPEPKPVTKPEPKPEVKPEPVKKNIAENKPTPEPKKPVADAKALYNPSPGPKATSDGDKDGATGDQGVKEGKIDARALYGTPGGGSGGGGGSGSGLELAGWRWDREPRVELPPTEKNGRLVFEIEVDENGDIIKLVPIERGLSPAAEKLCKEEILRRQFTPLGDKVPPVSKGRVTFVVKAH